MDSHVATGNGLALGVPVELGSRSVSLARDLHMGPSKLQLPFRSQREGPSHAFQTKGSPGIRPTLSCMRVGYRIRRLSPALATLVMCPAHRLNSSAKPKMNPPRGEPRGITKRGFAPMPAGGIHLRSKLRRTVPSRLDARRAPSLVETRFQSFAFVELPPPPSLELCGPRIHWKHYSKKCYSPVGYPAMGPLKRKVRDFAAYFGRTSDWNVRSRSRLS